MTNAGYAAFTCPFGREASAEIDRLKWEVDGLRKALLVAREAIDGHFDDGCEDCRHAVACIDDALTPQEAKP